jgi:mono/diheme cytochrome c family protein
MERRLRTLAAVALALLLSCQRQRQPSPVANLAPAPAPIDDDAGRELIDNNCVACHASEMLTQQRLSRPQWQAEVQKMRTWGAPLDDREAALLTEFLSARYGPSMRPATPTVISPERAAATLTPEPDGRFAHGQISSGRIAYERACATCHGMDARGTALAVRLADRPELDRAPEFAQVVRGGRGRMPAFADTSDREVAGLLAYLRQL